MLVRRAACSTTWGLMLRHHFAQARFILNGTHAQDQLIRKPFGVALLKLEKQVVHIVFADVIQHELLRPERHQLAAQLAAD